MIVCYLYFNPTHLPYFSPGFSATKKNMEEARDGDLMDGRLPHFQQIFFGHLFFNSNIQNEYIFVLVYKGAVSLFLCVCV